jgi:hypothetical protein
MCIIENIAIKQICYEQRLINMKGNKLLIKGKHNVHTKVREAALKLYIRLSKI